MGERIKKCLMYSMGNILDVSGTASHTFLLQMAKARQSRGVADDWKNVGAYLRYGVERVSAEIVISKH